MCNELHVSGYSKAHTVVTPNKYSCPSATHIKQEIMHYQGATWKKWNCGALACFYAATQKPKIIYLLGFDIVGKKHQNIYEGTLHYRKNSDKENSRMEYLLDERQFCWTFHTFPNIEFRRVGGMAIREFRRYRNYRAIKKIPYGNSKYEI